MFGQGFEAPTAEVASMKGFPRRGSDLAGAAGG